MLTQQEFAERLGIKQGYVTLLERDKKNPSEQLILSICREFVVNMEWLKHGTGEMYDKTPRFTPKGSALVEEISRVLVSAEKPVPLSTVARVLGIDPDKPSRKVPYIKDLSYMLALLVKILEEGDGKKIDAIQAQLRALAPEEETAATSKKRA